MTSPVLAALASARVAEEAQQERALTAKVLAHLKMPAPQGDRSHWPTWQVWCAKNNINAFPALPATVAVFVLNNAALSDRLEKEIASNSAVHQADGQADPVLSPIVIEALGHVISPIQPPPGWPKERKADFGRLDRGLQKFIVAHERRIVTEMRRAQNEAALAKRKEHINGTIEQDSSPAACADRTDAGADRHETPARSGGKREASGSTPA